MLRFVSLKIIISTCFPIFFSHKHQSVDVSFHCHSFLMFKQKADRTKVVQPPPPPVQHTEIVPGRLTEQNWQEIEEILDNEEIACEYVEEILNEILLKVYDVYLKQQLLPYTVSAAKDALLLVVEWNFLHRDESQVSPILQPGWIPDKEPTRPVIDNWAPGYFISPDEKSEEEIVEEQSLTKVDEEKELCINTTLSVSSLDKSQHDTIIPHVSPVCQPVEEPLLSQEICFLLGSDVTDSKISKAEREEQRKMEEALQELDNAPQHGAKLNQHNLQKTRDGRPPGIKDVFYDNEGNIVGVIKLNPDKLPSNRVKIEYQLPERDVGPVKMDKKRIRYKDKSTCNTSQSNFQRHPFGRSHKKPFAIESEELGVPPLKSMVEAIEPVMGVTVKDIHQMKMGPIKQGPTTQLLTECAGELRPITRKVPIPTTDLLEILQPTTTMISHSSSTPLPPIIQTPTSTGKAEAI
ncbi:unnamed protein product [Acanthosepion pharaonis]|uniref:Uncharacterized protein n=1 Tax=Acanthosepion pharaonis TaxID=158019 RepID=A0A812B400_ACAPH|nr:unnamed protein product [Sepia pharaonis]